MKSMLLVALPMLFSPNVLHAQRAPVYLDCLMDNTDVPGTKTYPSLAGESWRFLKIEPSTSGIYFYESQPGAGYYRGGGQWIAARELVARKGTDIKMTMDDRIFRVEAELRNAYRSYLEISRMTGGIRTNTYFFRSGNSLSNSGECTPTEDPETIPGPAAKF